MTLTKKLTLGIATLAMVVSAQADSFWAVCKGHNTFNEKFSLSIRFDADGTGRAYIASSPKKIHAMTPGDEFFYSITGPSDPIKIYFEDGTQARMIKENGKKMFVTYPVDILKAECHSYKN
jgi:hypothetical protein